MDFTTFKIFKKSSDLFIGQLFISLFSFLTSLITARALEPEGRGYLALTLLFANFFYIFTEFGLAKSTIRILLGKKFKKEIIISNYIYILITKVIFFGFIILFIIFFTKIYLLAKLPFYLLVISLFQFIPLALTGSLLNLLLGLDLYKLYNKILVLSSFFSLFILSLLFFFSDLTLIKVLVVLFITSCLNLFLISKILLNEFSYFSKINYSFIYYLFNDGLKFYLIHIIHFANNRFNFFIINFFLGPYSLGIYTLSLTLCERISIIPESISTILYSEFSKVQNKKSSQSISIIFRSTLIFTTIILIILFFISEWLITFLFTSSFEDLVLILKLLLIFTFFNSGWKIISQYFNAIGLSNLTLKIESISFFILIILSILLIPKYKLDGACISVIIYSFTNFLLGIIYFQKLDKKNNSLFKFSIREVCFIKKKLKL